MTWERKKLTKAAIPNPNALLDGKKHSFPLHLRSSSLFFFISAAIHKIKEIKPRDREIMMKKITVNLHLGGFSMVG